MRIAVITFGSEGDWRPIVALCQGLTIAGHDTVLFADRAASRYASEHGVDFAPLAGDLSGETRAASTRIRRNDYAPTIVRLAADLIRRNIADWMRVFLERAKHADAIVCGGLGTYVGLSCAEALRIPAVVVALQPLRPTRAFPSPLLPPVTLPGWLNLLTHRAVLAGLRRHFSASHNAARREVLGLPPRKSDWRGYPIVFAMSPTLVPRPLDWPARFSVVGYCWPPRDDSWRPDEGLVAFLDAGEPPVYVGFGSMLVPDPGRVQAAVLAALGSRRALLAQGWSRWDAAALPDTARIIEPAPHEWLFPRVAIAVHHGGAGTSHAAARAGVPSVVVPFATDQFFWADRLRRLGIAPGAIPQRRMTSSKLLRALGEAGRPEMAARARDVALRLACDHGVRDAVARVEQLVATTAPPE